jgi:hypothetical protein
MKNKGNDSFFICQVNPSDVWISVKKIETKSKTAAPVWQSKVSSRINSLKLWLN